MSWGFALRSVITSALALPEIFETPATTVILVCVCVCVFCLHVVMLRLERNSQFCGCLWRPQSDAGPSSEMRCAKWGTRVTRPARGGRAPQRAAWGCASAVCVCTSQCRPPSRTQQPEQQVACSPLTHVVPTFWMSLARRQAPPGATWGSAVLCTCSDVEFADFPLSWWRA